VARAGSPSDLLSMSAYGKSHTLPNLQGPYLLNFDRSIMMMLIRKQALIMAGLIPMLHLTSVTRFMGPRHQLPCLPPRQSTKTQPK